MHRHVVRAVRGDRQVEGLGEVRDLHEDGDAAAVGDVGLGIGHAAGRIICWNSHSVRKFSPVATGSPPSRRMRAWPATSSGMVGSSSQTRSKSRSARARADRLVGDPLHVGVDHQREAVAEVLAHGARRARRPRAAARGPTLVLMARKPFARLPSVWRSRSLTEQVEVDAAGVARHLRIVAAQQAIERQVRAPRLEVPQRHVERRERQHRRRRRGRRSAAPTRPSARPPRSARSRRRRRSRESRAPAGDGSPPPLWPVV